MKAVEVKDQSNQQILKSLLFSVTNNGNDPIPIPAARTVDQVHVHKPFYL